MAQTAASTWIENMHILHHPLGKSAFGGLAVPGSMACWWFLWLQMVGNWDGKYDWVGKIAHLNLSEMMFDWWFCMSLFCDDASYHTANSQCIIHTVLAIAGPLKTTQTRALGNPKNGAIVLSCAIRYPKPIWNGKRLKETSLDEGWRRICGNMLLWFQASVDASLCLLRTSAWLKKPRVQAQLGRSHHKMTIWVSPNFRSNTLKIIKIY